MCVARTCARRRRQLRQDKKSRRMFAARSLIRAGGNPKTPNTKGKK
jgi:hypothetical protein